MMYRTMLWIVRGIIVVVVLIAGVLMQQQLVAPALGACVAVLAVLVYHQIVTKKAKAEKELMASA